MSDGTTTTPALALEDLTLAYGETVAVDRLDLTIAKGELIALLGPSGCGKTTTMRAVAGLLTPRSGTIRLDGADVTRTAPNRRPVGLVFQSYALFPHLSVYENVAFGFRLRRTGADELHARVTRGLASVGLSHLSERKPAELSGGQQQRVALARSMVLEPKVLLLDEPLSNLDARLRLDMRAELQRIQRESGITMVYVTHDQIEALALADRIVVMREGRVEQIGTPEELYEAPLTAFVARFVGFENVFDVAEGALLSEDGTALAPVEAPSDAIGLAWRPGGVALGTGPFEGVVRGVSFAGRTREYVLESALGTIKAEEEAGRAVHPIGASVPFDLPVARAVVLRRRI